MSDCNFDSLCRQEKLRPINPLFKLLLNSNCCNENDEAVTISDKSHHDNLSLKQNDNFDGRINIFGESDAGAVVTVTKTPWVTPEASILVKPADTNVTDKSSNTTETVCNTVHKQLASSAHLIEKQIPCLSTLSISSTMYERNCQHKDKNGSTQSNPHNLSSHYTTRKCDLEADSDVESDLSLEIPERLWQSTGLQSPIARKRCIGDVTLTPSVVHDISSLPTTTGSISFVSPSMHISFEPLLGSHRLDTEARSPQDSPPRKKIMKVNLKDNNNNANFGSNSLVSIAAVSPLSPL